MHLKPFEYMGESNEQTLMGGLGLTISRYDASKVQDWHCHENPTLFFLLRGEFADESRELGFKRLKGHSLLIHPKEALHKSYAGEKGRVGLNIEPTNQWCEKYGVSQKDLSEYRITADPMVCTNLLRVSLGVYQSEMIHDSIAEVISSGSLRATEETIQWFSRIEKLIKQVDHRHWTLSALANELSVHPVYLARVFRQRYGVSVTQYLHSLRIKRASWKLTSTDNSIGQIAAECGFSDHAHLTRAIKSELGVSPKVLRKHLN